MALRNQPYLPLYVKDFLTDEKLIECSAETTGVYIRLMCIMHNAENYGQLKLSDKYNDKDIIKNYADILSKQMPYTFEIIYRSLQELLREKVIFFKKKTLTQKRMFVDGLLSIERAKAGSIGGKHSKQNASKHSSKTQANTEYEYITINDNNIISNNKIKYNKYGIYKRIVLSIEEYNKLVEEYTKEFIDNQINKLDEYVESNNNKNKYSNWNLVLRKSIREDWFKNKKNPDWFNKEIKKEEMSNGELAEMEETIKEFK